MKNSTMLKEIAAETGLLPSQVLAIASTAPLRYKVFKIPKRTGGTRTLAQPAREVKKLQYCVGAILRKNLPIHHSVAAYETGCSIMKNAAMHADGKFLLKMDFEGFFPSILESDFIKHLKKHHPYKFIDDDFELISRILFWAPNRKRPLQLCIGAPTSPFVSNTILFDFDCCASEIAASRRVTYTRYADDLSFSTGRPDVLEDVVGEIIKTVNNLDYPALKINPKKTIHGSRATRRVVTGIVLKPDGGLSVGRNRKRLIRSMWHRKSLGRLDDRELERLEGLVNFVESVEPGFRVRLSRGKVG